jgi:hypothetical protein
MSGWKDIIREGGESWSMTWMILQTTLQETTKGISTHIAPIGHPLQHQVTRFKSCMILYDISVIASRLSTLIVTSMYNPVLVTHVMRKAGWDQYVFNLVLWDAHERAFRRLPIYSQYSMAKLAHSLINTNWQNWLYYGQVPNCPICNMEEEKVQHVMSCPHQSVVLQCKIGLDKLQAGLVAIGTPQPVTEAIRYGIEQWSLALDQMSRRAPTAGSLYGPDAVLTSAYWEQHRIGWFNLCLGRISKKWAAVTR